MKLFLYATCYLLAFALSSCSQVSHRAWHEDKNLSDVKGTIDMEVAPRGIVGAPDARDMKDDCPYQLW
jgi:hypothetical protein